MSRRRSLWRLTHCAITDEGFFRHEKVRRAALAYGGDLDIAAALMRDYHTYHLAKSRKHDGFVSTATALEWDTLGSERASRAAAAMVASGLWDLAENGYQFHAYFEFYAPQRSTEEYHAREKARVAAYREQNAARLARGAARARKYRASRKARNVTRDEKRDDRESSRVTPTQKPPEQARISEANARSASVRRTADPCTPYPPHENSVTHPHRVTPPVRDAARDAPRGDNGNRPSLLAEHAVNGQRHAYAERTGVQKNGAKFCTPLPPVDQDPNHLGLSEDPDRSTRVLTAKPDLDLSEIQIARGHEPRAQTGAQPRTNGRTRANGRERPLRPYTAADDKTLTGYLIERYEAAWRALPPGGDYGQLRQELKDTAVEWCCEQGVEQSRSNRAANDAETVMNAKTESRKPHEDHRRRTGAVGSSRS